MKVEINDAEFDELAEKFHTTPESLIKSMIHHVKYMSIHAKNDIINGRDLDDVFMGLFEDALPGILLNDVIRNIVGEHDYVIDDGDYDMEAGIIWVDVSFLEGTVLNMGAAKLQFGKDPGIVATEYLEKYPEDLNFGEVANDAENDLDETDPTFDLDRGDSVEITDIDGSLYIFLQINWDDPLNFPRIAEIDEMMRKIKDMIFDSKNSDK